GSVGEEERRDLRHGIHYLQRFAVKGTTMPAALPRERPSTPAPSRPRSALMSQPDSIQPTTDTNGAANQSASTNDSAAQGASPGTTGPEVRADAGSPATEPATSLAQPRARLPADQVGRYRVLGEIGRGGMGAVLRSRDPELGRDLALKLMLGDPAGHAEAVQRFREEAQVGG